MLEYIGIEREIDKKLIKDYLSSVFPKWKIHLYNPFNGDMENEISIEKNSVLLGVTRNDSEFPICIDLFRTPDENTEERQKCIARLLSDYFDCKTITAFEDEEIPENPYYSVIFDNGHTFLANDANTMWGDGEGGLVKTIKEIPFKNYDFDESGNLIKVSS